MRPLDDVMHDCCLHEEAYDQIVRDEALSITDNDDEAESYHPMGVLLTYQRRIRVIERLLDMMDWMMNRYQMVHDYAREYHQYQLNTRGIQTMMDYDIRELTDHAYDQSLERTIGYHAGLYGSYLEDIERSIHDDLRDMLAITCWKPSRIQASTARLHDRLTVIESCQHHQVHEVSSWR
jgi:hypothetical protein